MGYGKGIQIFKNLQNTCGEKMKKLVVRVISKIHFSPGSVFCTENSGIAVWTRYIFQNTYLVILYDDKILSFYDFIATAAQLLLLPLLLLRLQRLIVEKKNSFCSWPKRSQIAIRSSLRFWIPRFLVWSVSGRLRV